MADDLFSSMKLSAAGMKAQGTRLRVISENLANADSLPTEPGKNPYRRKSITFKNVMNKELGMQTVKVDKIRPDRTEFQRKFEPSHPAADAQGYVLAPNVNSLVEVMDMREAQRSYEANLSAIRTARTMMQGTIDILR
jgi:flagellar basal-body rod protein FlgC